MNSPLIIDRWSTPKISLRASDGQWIVSSTSSQQDQLCWQVLSRDKALELVDILSKMYRPIDLKLWVESERLPMLEVIPKLRVLGYDAYQTVVTRCFWLRDCAPNPSWTE